jgi:iron(III) transport system substrate-binding protein
MLKQVCIVAALVATVALPFALKPKPAVPKAGTQEALVIITPHNEAIRFEYGRGFQEWYHARTGKNVAVDWRVIGGTSEIARFLDGEYTASFQNLWTGKLGRPWSAEVQAGFQNGRLPADAPVAVKEARAAFLASDVSCGIDVFFGGGTYDYVRQAQAGRTVDGGMKTLHPDWFTDAVIPRFHAGEEYWDGEGRWYGTVLSSYGIVFNRDSLKRLGFEGEPTQWTDMKDPRLAGEVALADPTKSSSIAKAFENIIQQQMQRRLKTLRAAEPNAEMKALEARAVREGWVEGLRLLQLIGANSRYFTDSSQKPPIDVAAGNCAVGLCIDFYGRQQQEAVTRRDNSNRVGYVSPEGGSVGSVDPIALLRGAKHREAAVAFIEYSLSMDGQKLWNFKPGTTDGPERFALRRLPVRKDFFTHAEWKPWRSDPEDAPFDQKEQLVYWPEWTGGLFREMSFVLRVMCQDTHPELVRAWRAIIAAQGEAKVRALAELQDLSAVDYETMGAGIKRALNSKNKVDELTLARDLGAEFRSRYLRAEGIAQGR